MNTKNSIFKSALDYDGITEFNTLNELPDEFNTLNELPNKSADINLNTKFSFDTNLYELDKAVCIIHNNLLKLNNIDKTILNAFIKDNKIMRTNYLADKKNIYKYCIYIEWLNLYKKISYGNYINNNDIEYLNWLYNAIL